MAFAIVQWEGFVPPEVSIVPSSWLCLDDGVLMSYWPSSADGDKSIKKRSEPKKTWGKYAVQQIGKADSYEQALKKLKAAELRSDLSAESSDDIKTRHDRCRISRSSEDEVAKTSFRTKRNSSTQHAVEPAALCGPPPPIPPGLISLVTTTSSSRSAASDLSSTVTAIRCHTLHAVTPVCPQIASPVTTPVTVSCFITRPRTSTTSEFQSPLSVTNTSLPLTRALELQSVSTQQPISVASARSATSELCSSVTANRCHTLHAVTPIGPQIASPGTTPVTVSCSITRPPTSTADEFESTLSVTNTPLRATLANMQLQSVSTQLPTSAGLSAQLLQVLVTQNAEIKQQVLFNTQLLQEIVRRQRGKDVRGPIEKPCSLPLKSYEEVQDVEQKLKSKEFYSNMVSYLTLIGGSTIKDFIGRTMTRLLDSELAKGFVWAGRLTEKHAFKSLELKNVVFDATLKNPLTTKATMDEVDEEIKVWLRGAPDRNGGRSERAKAKAKAKRKAMQRDRSPERSPPRQRRREHSRRSVDDSPSRRISHNSSNRSRDHSPSNLSQFTDRCAPSHSKTRSRGRSFSSDWSSTSSLANQSRNSSSSSRRSRYRSP